MPRFPKTDPVDLLHFAAKCRRLTGSAFGNLAWIGFASCVDRFCEVWYFLAWIGFARFDFSFAWIGFASCVDRFCEV